ncbi:hypothetical protein Zmor_023009 [Zophobas morio]|uniref:Uncharacterized protein n=1 Tax=Zophobas morio TaxID=2755281 RepID=A0AA38HW79_9CUCU|nr:hypothetical protein Zmor_023009 [Zophobas morio]
MILLHTLLLFSILLPALSAPDRAEAMSRITEARARLVANRAKHRANPARFTTHGRPSIPSRSKRQYAPQYEPYPYPPPPPPPQSYAYEDPEPIPVHICSIEDDEYARNAEPEEESHDFHHFSGDHDQAFPGVPRESEQFDDKARAMNVWLEESQGERPLDRALEELSDVRDILSGFDGLREAETLPTETLPAETLPAETTPVNVTVITRKPSKPKGPQPGAPEHRGPIVKFDTQGGDPEDTDQTRDAEADPHLHSRFHTHLHSTVHGHGLPFPPTHISTSGLHLPATQVITPGLNLNINQNQNVNQGLNSGLHRGIGPIIPGGIVSPLSHSLPSQSAVISTQTQPVFQVRQSAASPDAIEAQGPERQPNPSTLPSHFTHPDSPNFQSAIPGFSVSRSGEETFDEDGANFGDEEEVPSGQSRHASPTHKKKKKMKHQPYQSYPSYSSYYPRPTYGRYREAEQEGDFLAEDREASPTHHKKKHQKSHYSPYREADENDQLASAEDLLSSLFMSREASPTHSKKPKFTTVYYPTYNKQPHYYGQSGHYREAEDIEDQRRQRDENDDLEDLISSNFLFDFPARRSISGYKRSTEQQLDQILGQQRQIVESLQHQSKNDEDLKLVADISNRTLTDLEEKSRKISKRSIPITRLISDPKVKLDVPQTVENFGTATKHSFEDERAPMYHLKHMIGSSKNALLSAMRIPPQNMIIPSDYEIVRSSESGVYDNEPDDDPSSHTFTRVGQMVRNSIKSGQETAAHLSDVAHSAKNMFSTARHSAPRLIIPYSQIPALQDTRRPRPNKALLLTPRILDLAEETRKSSDSRPNFVRLGHLMDAVGISKPNPKSLELQKIVFGPRGISEGRADEKLAELYSKFRHKYDDDVETVGEAISTLEDAKISVGAKDLRDFLVKMRGELTSMVQGTPVEYKKKPTLKKKKKEETKEMGRFIETLFDGSKPQPKNDERTEDGKTGENEVVGDRMFLSPELLHPFMGRASEADVKSFLRDNGDNLDKKDDASKNHYEELTGSTHDDGLNNSDLGYVLGAINPLMFERMYNQTVKINKEGVTDPQEMFQHQRKKDDDGTVGTSFTLSGPMLKPFMGGVQPQEIENFLDTYNRGESSEFEENEK